MEKSLKGMVVVIRFPFSDLTGSKKRPALVVADWGRNDVILAQVTSVAHKDVYAVSLNDGDFEHGNLQKESFIRPNKLFTADKASFIQTIGHINPAKVQKVSDTITILLQINNTENGFQSK